MRITNKRGKWTWVSPVDVVRGDQRPSSLIVLVSKVSRFGLTKGRGAMLLYHASAHIFSYKYFPISLPRLPCGPIYCSSLCLVCLPRLVSCSVTCTLTLPPFLIMERVSPTVHLTVLSCVLVVNLPTFPLLHRRSLRLHSIFELLRQPQTWIMISNSTFVFPPVVLLALIVSKTILLDNGNFEFCVRHSN